MQKSSEKDSTLSVYWEALMDMIFPLNLYCHLCKNPLPKHTANRIEQQNGPQTAADTPEQQNVPPTAADTPEQQNVPPTAADTHQISYQDYLCTVCMDEIRWIDGLFCKKCSIPIEKSPFPSPAYQEEILRPLPRPKDLCAECEEDSPLDRNLSVCLYEKPIKTGIYGFKYSDKTYLARIFALMMANKLRSLPKPEQDFDLILSVPLHKKRLRQRGYNQADLLAKYLSKELQIPYNPKALLRRKETRTMNQLSKSQRAPNVKDAFLISKDFPITNRILLVDDIYTTGATAKSVAACLKAQGSSHVTMISIARVKL